MRLQTPRLLLVTGACALHACGGGAAPGSGAATEAALSARVEPDHSSHRPGFSIVPPHRRVRGKTTAEWVPEYWRYLYSVPASENPELVDAADCGVGQSGPVFFLPGEQHDVYTRRCDVPAHTPVLFSIWSAFNDYPCPDPTFQPAPGQSLEDFLASGARAFDDQVTELAATVDGHAIDVARHRITTGLVAFTGDPSLTSTFDGCVTGTPQVGVADGWFVLLRLSRGEHTLEVTANAPSGRATRQTFVLDVAGGDGDGDGDGDH